MHLTKALNLTSDQSSKLEPILADRDQKLAALKANDALTPKDIHQQMHAIHKSAEDQLATILTPDQLQQLQQMKSQHHNHGGPQAQPPATPPSA